MKYSDQIQVFYREEMVPSKAVSSVSQSPLKPKRFMEYLENTLLWKNVEVRKDWDPFTQKDFHLAHTRRYVKDFFDGVTPLATSNGLNWNLQFANSVRYTNASLYEAIKTSIQTPEKISLSPTSGFHHARPEGGGGFCTFSGQVIASLKVYEEFGKAGCYIDLDGHYGNSIDDTRDWLCSTNVNHPIEKAIPSWLNVNPMGEHQVYINSLKGELFKVKETILDGSCDYVVFCHGADSHEWDDLGGQCTTDEWIECSKLVYTMVKETSQELGKHIPLTLALFGGYRKNGYTSVLELHTACIAKSLNILAEKNDYYHYPVVDPRGHEDLVSWG